MRTFAGALLISLFVGLTNASAVLVDWSTQTWTPGSLSNSFDVDPGSAGNDVTVTVSGNTAQLQPGLVAPNPQTPAITSAFDGGFSPGHLTLELAVDFTANTQAVTVTIDFSLLYAAGVANVSFNLFDIDFLNSGGNTYQDVIRTIQGTSILGAAIAPTITAVGPNVTLSGSGINQVLTGMVSTVDKGVGSGGGNATITFNATDIRSITFTYGSSAMFPNPTYQHIGLDNIDFTVVPEMDPTPFTFVLCGGLVIGTTIRRRAGARRAKNPVA